MDEHFATIPVTNAMRLCVGSITRAEAEAAREDGADIDGLGYYLFVADETAPHAPIRVLAKFVSSSLAEELARTLARDPFIDSSG